MCFVAQGHTSLTTDTIDVDGSSNLHRLCKLRLFNLLPAINLKETHRLLKMTVSMSKSSLGIKPVLFFSLCATDFSAGDKAGVTHTVVQLLRHPELGCYVHSDRVCLDTLPGKYRDCHENFMLRWAGASSKSALRNLWPSDVYF